MKKITAITIGGLIALVIIMGFIWHNSRDAPEPLGSVQQASEYHSTSSVAMESGAAFGARIERIIATTTPFGDTIMGDARLTPITLGSVVVSSSTTGTLIIHNATSTVDISSTTVAIFDNDSNTTIGTYVFDIVLDRGLVLDFSSGFWGSYVITWR